MSFVQAQVRTDPDDLTDQGVDQINATLAANGFANWTAADATLAVIILNTVAQLFADIAQTAASTVLPAIFRAFGTQLFGIAYQNGTQASVTSLWTFTSPAPDSVSYDIAANTALQIDGQTFYTQTDYTAQQNDVTATIVLIAAQPGTAFNNLGGVSQPIELNQQIDWVQSVVTIGVSSNGQDAQSDDDYQNSLASELQLQAPRPIVNSDLPVFVTSNTAVLATGVTVGRATALDGYYPDGRALSGNGVSMATSWTCQTGNGSVTVYYTGNPTEAPEVGATVTGTGIPANTTVAAYPPPNDQQFALSQPATATGTASLTISAMTGYGPPHLTALGTTTKNGAAVTITTGPYLGAIPDIGARVTGQNVPSGTTVLATPAPTASGFTMSNQAAAAGTNVTLTISSWTSVQLAETTFVTDIDGNQLTAANMDAVQAWLQTYRPTGYIMPVVAPSYTPVFITALLKVSPGFDGPTVAAAAQAALIAWLDPASWGAQVATTGGWRNEPTVYYNRAVAAATVRGVDDVVSLTLGSSANPTATTDLTMSGPAPLPITSLSQIVVTTE